MKAKVIQPFFFSGKRYEKGEIIEAATERIKSFLGSNLVEEIKEQKEEEVEEKETKAMQNPVEDKMVKEPEQAKKKSKKRRFKKK